MPILIQAMDLIIAYDTSSLESAPSNEVTYISEIYDGEDNDFDGSIDEGFNIGDVCTVGQGACQRAGALVLVQMGLVQNIKPKPESPQ